MQWENAPYQRGNTRTHFFSDAPGVGRYNVKRRPDMRWEAYLMQSTPAGAKRMDIGNYVIPDDAKKACEQYTPLERQEPAYAPLVRMSKHYLNGDISMADYRQQLHLIVVHMTDDDLNRLAVDFGEIK